MTSGIDPAANAEAIVGAIAEARREGAAMLFTPEMCGLLDRDRKRGAVHVVAEGENPVLAAAREAAAREGIWVHLARSPCRAMTRVRAGTGALPTVPS